MAAGKKGGIGTELFTIKAKPNSDTNSRVNYVVADQVDVNGTMVPAGISGDGRLRDGSSSNGGPSEYQSTFCGVRGRILNVTGAGTMDFDPDGNSQAICGAARYYTINIDTGPVHTSPGIWKPGPAIWSIGVGQSASMAVNFGFDSNAFPCQVLAFDAQYGVANLLITRIDDGTGPRKWIMRTQGLQMGACVAAKLVKGTLVYYATGRQWYLPFSMTITELPYPWVQSN